MYQIDKEPTSDQTYCDNCDSISDKIDITETSEGDPGCPQCISKCAWCGVNHYIQDMYLCAYYGLICNDCIKADDYKKGVRDKVLKESLRYYFDNIDHKTIENTIIEVAKTMGFDELAREMKNDL